MFRQTLFFFGFLRKNLDKYLSSPGNDRMALSVMVILAILLFSFKTSSGQGQQSFLGRALEEYIEETAAFIDLSVPPDEGDLFLSQGQMVQASGKTTIQNLSLTAGVGAVAAGNGLVTTNPEIPSKSDVLRVTSSHP